MWSILLVSFPQTFLCFFFLVSCSKKKEKSSVQSHQQSKPIVRRADFVFEAKSKSVSADGSLDLSKTKEEEKNAAKSNDSNDEGHGDTLKSPPREAPKKTRTKDSVDASLPSVQKKRGPDETLQTASTEDA
ncbi:hypothetical protein L596_015875 [Steinernema carpocapsae]|uniref:Uncharacterized protein n=1 Tax=Steinernema carpocapsae TaxID=34508 RepID=A0A4U5NHB5_STECR|nr:hypothetical protein L596_015875 [Steinernema carpocapsae]